jgi:hypothetical protein
MLEAAAMAFARAVSILGHPFVTMPLAIAWALIGNGLSGRITLTVVLSFMASVSVVAVYAIVGVRRGRFTNIDVSKREQRPAFYAVMIASTLLCAVAFLYLQLPIQIVRGTFVSAGLMTASLIVNYRLKCSLHVAYTVFPLAVVWAQAPLWGRIAGVLFVLLMMWSRVRMGRHSVAETVAGAVLGTIAGIALNVG